MMLGLGEDGHTASIFPDNLKALESEATCFVAIHPVSGQKRVSVSGKIINASKQITFLVAGDSKSEKFSSIYRKENSEKYPANYIQAINGQLHWFLDKSAAKGSL